MDRDEIAQVHALLQESGLPVNDLESAAIDFLVIHDGGQITGVIGVEKYGETGLLRSLAVKPTAMGRGMGSLLVRAIERHACAMGIGQLVLLTETAAPFFSRHGFRLIGRNAVPALLRKSDQFRTLCPSSASCMRKKLGSS